MSQKKIGRPVSLNLKDTMFRVRLDGAYVAKLDECAEELKTTRSDIVRKGIDKIHGSLKKK
ncbi:MAG: CopG family transcriptional regulator [Oscillospiraceae bacterium]|nr:CopG family transcriptional regulator [Oscillospiraceae bacterium]